MNELVINDLVKYVTFQYNNAKHVNDMMLKAFSLSLKLDIHY